MRDEQGPLGSRCVYRACRRSQSARRVSTGVLQWGLLTAVGPLTACGGDPSTRPFPINDSCLGNAVALRPLTDTVPVDDSVHVLALRAPAFTACLSGVPFVLRWEARPDSAVVLSADSDTSAWVRGVTPGSVTIFARITSMDEIKG